MIEVRYKGRLGNNMFQYCLGRILAEGLGFALKADPIPAFPSTAQYVDGACHEGPEQVLTGHRIDLAELLADRSPRKIVLDGWFQCYEYYRPHGASIREWLAFDPSISVPHFQPEVVVNVRRTDYVWLGWALPFCYYEAALTHLLPNGGKIWIVTDDRRDPFFRQFARWRPRFFSGTAPEQMLFMATASRLVMSPSTFSWWPTFLGDPKEVVCPLSSFGAWSKWGGEAGEARLIERDRFICIESHTAYQPTKSEVWHQKRRALWRRLVLALNHRLSLSLAEPPL
jgi:hypothetical protein